MPFPAIRRRRSRAGSRRAGGRLGPGEEERGDLPGGRLGDETALHGRAARQERQPVGRLEDLREPVGDQDDGLSRLRSLPERGEEGRGLVGSQDGGRLVEDQDGRVPRERPCDLDPLPRPDREVVDEGVRIAQVEREGPGEPADPGAAGRRRLEDRCRDVEEGEVVGDGGRLDEEIVLGDEGDPVSPGFARSEPGDLASVEKKAPPVGAEGTGGDRDERRLSGAVLPEEGVDLARTDLEEGARESAGRAEALPDVAELEGQKFPRGTARAPDSISPLTRATSSRTWEGTDSLAEGLQAKETTPEERP